MAWDTTTDYWNSPEFLARVEEMVRDMKANARICSAAYFHDQYGWDCDVEMGERDNDKGFYWLACGLVARGYRKNET